VRPDPNSKALMAKPFKIFLWIVGILVGLIATAALAVVMLFDPNEYKDDAAKTVKESTGRELKITGDIKLTLFPWLGASVAGVELGNAQGFGPEPFAQVAEMNVGVKLMPLLFGNTVEVAKIRIDGLALNLTKAADGTNNWQDLAKSDEEADEPKEPETPTPEGEPMKVTIGGVEIKNATFSYTDKQSGAAYKVADLSVETGAIEQDQPLDVVIAFVVNSAKPQLDSDVKISFTVVSDTKTQVTEVKDLKVDSETRGPTVPGGSQKATVRGHARYDGAKGTFAFTDGVLEAAGLTVNAALQGEGLDGDAPKYGGKISTNTFSPKDVAKSFGVDVPTTDPKALTQASFSSNIAAGANDARFDGIVLKLDQTTFGGHLAIPDLKTGAMQFALKGDSIDADRYLAPAGPEQKAAEKGSGDFKNTPIPVDALDAINARGTIELASLKLKGLQLTNIRISLDAPKGEAKTQEMTALLYGGKITQSARFTHNSPWKYDMKVGLDAINSAPLLKDLVGKSFLSGIGNLNLNVSSGGETVGAFLQALSGNVATSFDKGAIEGFNLKQTIDQAKATFQGQAAPAETGPKRTEFRDLKAGGKIVNGVLDTDNFDVKGDGYQLGGDGKVNLVEQTFDYTLTPTVSGEKYKDLQGVKIPIAVTGSWYDPKIKVDLAGVVKGRAKEEIKKQEEKVKEKAKSKLGDFLKKYEPKPAPAPAPAPKEEPKTEQPAPAEQPPPAQ
jgi:AsmA protein